MLGLRLSRTVTSHAGPRPILLLGIVIAFTQESIQWQCHHCVASADACTATTLAT
jgi:hypothetical protein